MTFITATTINESIEAIAINGLYKNRAAHIITIMGRREDTFNSTSNLYDVVEFLGSTEKIIPDPSAGIVMEIVSTSSNDTNGGTGANVVRVYYLDSSNILADEEVTMNGTTAVSLNSGSAIKYILLAECHLIGSNETAVGTINIQTSGGGTIYERITAGGNRSLSCRFKIPTGYTGYVIGWNASAINHNMDLRLRATIHSLNHGSIVNNHHFISNMYLGKDTNFVLSKLPYIRVQELGEIKVSAKPDSTANPIAAAEFQLLLIANS
jgi:hypothetical protein